MKHEEIMSRFDQQDTLLKHIDGLGRLTARALNAGDDDMARRYAARMVEAETEYQKTRDEISLAIDTNIHPKEQS